jgi:uncharacterized membrane protein
MDISSSFTLASAIMAQPLWLQAWVFLLMVANLGAIFFILERKNQRTRIRPEPLAIVFSMMVAGIFMEWLYVRYGYVRLLGLAHLVAWTPVYVWILLNREKFKRETLYGKYIHFYLLVAGISLVLDSIDIFKYIIELF